MEPQILLAEGVHNNDITTSAQRIITSGVWEPQRIVIVIPAGASIPSKVMLGWWSLIFPPNNASVRLLALGMEVGEAYTRAFRMILDHPEFSKWEYILTLEHDNIPPSDGVLKLVEAMRNNPQFTAISGLYWTKGEGGVPQIWGDIRDPILNFRPQPPLPDTLQECYGIGMGFALWRIRALREKPIPDPIFRTEAGPTGVSTQDLYFWREARPHGHRCAVLTSVKVGHYEQERDIVW